MQTNFCYEEPESHYCLPQGELNEIDHYFVSRPHFHTSFTFTDLRSLFNAVFLQRMSQPLRLNSYLH